MSQFTDFWRTVVNNPPGKLQCPNAALHLHTLLDIRVFDEKGIEQKKYHRQVKDRAITNKFVQLIVNRMVGTSSDVGQYLHNAHYHESGSGSTGGESQTDTGLAQGGSSANASMNTGTYVTASDAVGAFQSVCTITYTTTSTGLVINEHGLFTATSATNGLLVDRTAFTAITVQTGWSIQYTYTVTFSAGG